MTNIIRKLKDLCPKASCRLGACPHDIHKYANEPVLYNNAKLLQFVVHSETTGYQTIGMHYYNLSGL